MCRCPAELLEILGVHVLVQDDTGHMACCSEPTPLPMLVCFLSLDVMAQYFCANTCQLPHEGLLVKIRGTNRKRALENHALGGQEIIG